MSTMTQHGYLVLADLSAYTSYLAGVELDRADKILTDLLEILVGKLRALLTVAKIEGDAVFAYAPESKVAGGEILLETDGISCQSCWPTWWRGSRNRKTLSQRLGPRRKRLNRSLLNQGKPDLP